MLAVFRNSLNHIATKILLGLLVLTFVIWGVGDILRAPKADIAIKIGDVEYTKNEWLQFYKTQYDRLDTEYKQTYSQNNDELRDILLHQLIKSELLKQEAKRLSILIGTDAVKYEIINSMPGLMSDGKFDKEKLSLLLSKAGMSESAFVDRIKEELAQKTLVETISYGNLLNPKLLEQITQSMHSKRVLEIYRANPNDFNIKRDVSDADLQTILDENKLAFSVPEKRFVSYIKFKIAQSDPAKEKVAQDEVIKFYQERSYLFQTPEKRKFLKLVFADEAKAKDVYKELSDGVDFLVLAQKLKLDAGSKSPTVTKDGFEEGASNAIFSLKNEEFSKPILTALGWCIFKVTEIIPAATQPLPIVQKEIEVQIAEQHSYDRYVKLMQDIDRDIGSNLSLNDIAAKYNLSVSQATLDDSNTEQRKTDNILNNKDFISTVYTTAKDTTSGVTSSIPDTESFVVHVNNIEEAFVMDLQSIRDKVLKIWLKDQQEHLASESIITAREQVAATGKLDEVGYIKSAKINIALLDNKEFTVDQIIEIFAAPLGSVTGVFDLKNGDKAFAKIVSVVSHDPAIVQGFLAENARRFNNLQHVLMNDYFSYLYKTYNVKIYDVSTQ